VDEAQDLSPWQWRLIRAAVSSADDDIFIAADPHQRIYNHRVSLRDVGISVAGRSTKLNLNYRTTAEILSWSLGLLRGEPIDDMDGSLDSIAGCRSEVHGDPPALRGYPTRDAEMSALTDTVKHWLKSGVEPSEIGVAARANWHVQQVLSALRAASVPAESLADNRSQEDAVAVGTMHRMKGLEFRCLAVVGVSDGVVPPANAITPLAEDGPTHRQDMQRERCLLFVACTRAREQLSVTWHGSSSPLLTALT
jgi:superfamily I DNA/RNA helicase